MYFLCMSVLDSTAILSPRIFIIFFWRQAGKKRKGRTEGMIFTRLLSRKAGLGVGECQIIANSALFAQSATSTEQSSVPNSAENAKIANWRKGWDSNPREPCDSTGFRNLRFRPLSHPSICFNFILHLYSLAVKSNIKIFSACFFYKFY